MLFFSTFRLCMNFLFGGKNLVQELISSWLIESARLFCLIASLSRLHSTDLAADVVFLVIPPSVLNDSGPPLNSIALLLIWCSTELKTTLKCKHQNIINTIEILLN